MKNNEVIERTAVQRRFKILEILVRDGNISCVEDHGLLIEHDIAVVRDALREREQILKESQSSVAAADPVNVLGYFLDIDHNTSSILIFFRTESTRYTYYI